MRRLGPASRWQVDVIPAGVQQLIELQLGRLSKDEQRVLEAASLVGVEFAVASVAAALQVSSEMAETACAALAQHGLFLETSGLAAWPDGTLSGQYRFRHALYQQVLSRRLTEVQRAQGHQRIGTRLEGGYGARAGEIAAELAVHFEQGRDYRRAVQYVRQATRTLPDECLSRGHRTRHQRGRIARSCCRRPPRTCNRSWTSRWRWARR